MPKRNKTTLFEKCGAIVGLIGGILGILGGGITIYDRFSEPELDILGVAPIATWERIRDDIDKSVWGISLIARVKNSGSKPSYVTGANISGNIYLSYSEFYPIYMQNEPNSNPEKIKFEFNALVPYRRVSWIGWLSDKQGLLRVDPDEERYIKITFSKPILSMGVTMINGNPFDEIGYEKTNIIPKSINHNPAIQWFMEGNALRKEFKNNQLRIEITLGNKSKQIELKNILKLKAVTKAAWDEYTPRKIYHDLK